MPSTLPVVPAPVAVVVATAVVMRLVVPIAPTVTAFVIPAA
jgi:hypothetical protein